MWETTIEKTRTISQRTIGRYLCTVIDHGRAIRWYVRIVNIFFGGPEGDCTSIEDGQRQAEACIELLNDKTWFKWGDQYQAELDAAVREGGDE